MLFQRVNRTDAEKVFVIVYNASGGAFTTGQAMQWDVTPTADGVRVTTPTTAQLSAFAGLATAGIANAAYGLAQVYGFNSTASVVNDITTALVAGNILVPVAGSANLNCATPVASDGKSGFVVAMQTNTTATAGAIAAAATKVFIRAL